MNSKSVDSKWISLFSGAGAAALFLLAACQQAEIPVQPKPQDTGVQTPAAAPVGESRLVSEAGRKATDAEVARILATRENAPAVELPEGASPLAKSAALPTCIVDFNKVNSLALLPSQASTTIAFSPFYRHPCNGVFWAHTNPINSGAGYRLIPENPEYCSGPAPYIGYKSGASCISQTEGKFWPRKAANLGSNTAVRLYVKNSGNVAKNFDLQAIHIHSGVAEIVAYRPGIGWWVWYPLAAGSRWTWPAGTAVSEIQVYSHGQTDPVQFDNVEIGILP